jgi:type VI secretion system protein ImpL
MSAQVSQIKSILGISALVSFYGIASLAVVFLGPSIGIPFVWEIVIIALLLLTLPFAILIAYFSKRRARKREAAEAAALNAGGDQPPVKTGAAPKRVYEELTRGAEEVVQWLRSTRLGGAKSSEALYALPWYLVAGPPASGKTSLVLSSGLDFHALPSQRRAEMKIVRPTHHCEWRVTDSAVLVDTAGRYQGDGPSRDEWIALTETLKKHRNVRALDGVVVAVNAARVLQSNETELEQQAKTLRARLDEMTKLVRARFPVYLVFTNIDALEGFEEFFKDGKSNREVWGATIPLEKSANAHALFDVEFDHLYESLLRRRLLRLRVPAAPLTQLRIFDFPVRFAEKRQKIGLFASALFRPNPFSESPLLRGFYFTANVTKGSKAQALAPEDGERSAQAVGTGYFTDRFFKEVVLSDKDLAASFQANQKKPPKTGAILLILGAILLFGLLTGSMVSYLTNRKLLTEGTERGLRVDEITRADFGKDVTKKDATAARVEVETLDALREKLVELDEGPPIYMRFGLYSGNDVAPYLRTIYFDAVEERFKKPTVAALEADLRAFVAGQPTANTSNPTGTSTAGAVSEQSAALAQEEVLGRHYDLLKAYLMLSDYTRVEPTFLASTISDYWKRTAPPDTEILSLQELDYYARQLVRDDAPHIKVDDRLVSEARRKLVAYPPVNRFYKRIVTEINAKTTPVSIESVLEGRGRGVLNGAYTVPGSYTVDGFRNYMKSSIENAGEEISKDDWVMNTVGTAGNQAQSTDISKLQALYLRDYTDQWRKFLRGISVRPFKTKDDAVESLRALSATDSPMERVMSEVARNTNLSKKPESTGIWGWIKSWFSTNTDNDLGGSTEVEKEFRPLFQFVTSGENKKESSPMSQYRAELRRVLDPLESSSENQLQQTSQALLTGKDELGLQKAEQTIAAMLEGFKTAAATDTANLLKQPLQNMRAFLYGGGNEQIVKGWNEQVYPKARAIEAGYPFTDSGEASLADLSGFLNPVNGQFTTFFNQKLASSFDDAQGQWRLKESGVIRFSDDFVKYLNNARKLREALFANGGQQPEVGYDLTLQPVPNADVVIEIDGTKVETRGNSPQSAKFIWPARSGASGVRITVVAGGGEPADTTFPGTWGLFKMVDAGSRMLMNTDQYDLMWDVGGVQVRATLRPASTNNPFQRSLFKNLHAPQNLQK